jgi:hypothetical protein
VIGAVVGGVAGAAVDPPAEVRTYIAGQTVPPVTYNGQVAVGTTLPETITMYDVPQYERYRWSYVNNQRVLIDRSTRQIVAVLDDTHAGHSMGAHSGGMHGATTAQSTVVTQKPSAGAGVGVVSGAATGAALGGPVGAVIGAVVGGVAGAAVDPPAEVRTYVTGQRVPPVTYNGQIAVGQTLPSTVTMYDVPQYERYRWAYLNNQRVLIDRSNNQIVAVINN